MTHSEHLLAIAAAFSLGWWANPLGRIRTRKGVPVAYVEREWITRTRRS